MSIRLGIEIGGSKLQIVVGDHSGRIIDRVRSNVEPSLGGEGIRQSIAKHLPNLIQKWQAQSIGAGFGGPVDTTSGTICCSHQIQGWSDFPLGTWLQELSGVPARVENDANTAALGEAALGAGVGCDPVFYITLGSGVGGGLVVGGSIYHGALPGEAEIGHVRLDRIGQTVESRCSGWAVDARIRERARQGGTVLGELIAESHRGEARFLVAALRAGDSAAREIFDELIGDLAFALSHVAHLFHPSAIILGGGLSLMGEVLREGIERGLKAHIMTVFRPGPVVRLAKLAEDAVPVGALLLAELARQQEGY